MYQKLYNDAFYTLSMQLTFLGTSGMLPTKERNVQSLYLEHEGTGILLDCGEGTQRQLSLAGIKPQKITTILISHWHGDHMAGLLGLLQTMDNFCSDNKQLNIYGPVGSKNYFDHILKSCSFELAMTVQIHEIQAPSITTISEIQDLTVEAINLDHSIPCLGYRVTKKDKNKILKEKLPLDLQGPLIGCLQRGEDITFKGHDIKSADVTDKKKGSSVAFIFDTRLCNACDILAMNATVLVSEAVYADALEHKAREYGHLTARQVGKVAKRSAVKKLVLTHFSQRYKTTDQLQKEATEEFVPVYCAYDFMKIKI